MEVDLLSGTVDEVGNMELEVPAIVGYATPVLMPLIPVYIGRSTGAVCSVI